MTGNAVVAASQWRPEFSACIETILEDVSELSDDDCKDDPEKILKWRILVFWRNYGEVLRASTRVFGGDCKYVASVMSVGNSG